MLGMARMFWLLAKWLGLPLILLATVAYLRWDFAEVVFQRALERLLTQKLGTRWSCESMVVRKNAVEFKGVLVANGPGEWEAPFSLRIRRVRLQYRLLGFMSLFGELTAGHFRLGPLEFTFGFRVKEIEAADFAGVELYLEDAEEVSSSSVAALKQGVLRKVPQSGFGAVRSRHGSCSASRSRFWSASRSVSTWR